MDIGVSGHGGADIDSDRGGVDELHMTNTLGIHRPNVFRELLPVCRRDHSGDQALAQARQSCVNVGEILKAAGIGYEQVIKTTCFLADMADFAAFNQVYEEFFVSKPARSCVAVKELPKGVLCEIEAIGVKSV